MTAINRFDSYLDKLSEMLSSAVKEENPALHLLKVDARNILFRIEALCRIYAAVYDSNYFEKLMERVKIFEDQLGKIDDFLGSEKALRNIGENEAILTKLHSKALIAASELNSNLEEKNWFNGKRIEKIRMKIHARKYFKPKKEIRRIKEYFDFEIMKIIDFHKLHFDFTELESQVHELRRKLRWLSIYPHALNGAVQLTNSNYSLPQLLKYQTQEIVLSPFNKMPDAANNKHFIIFERDRFLALSWIIAELGKLKDKGLLKETVENTAKEIAIESFTISTFDDEAIILNEASNICKKFFDEKNLRNLIYGLGRIKKE
ncbi:MAG: hypothetical protein JSR00_02670 [Bacteroidetes bacterium]|nr:hypothetical protein [Bacteroidota bacterium]